MMSIAMNIKYPTFFAASYLVACQWSADLITPALQNVRWWITVSQDDRQQGVSRRIGDYRQIGELWRKRGARGVERAMVARRISGCL